MITVVSNIHTSSLVLPGLLVDGLFLLGYLGIRLIDLWIGHMRHPHPQLLDEYADIDRLAASVRDEQAPYVGFDPPEIAPEDEPSWPGKVSPPERHLFALHEQPMVYGAGPAQFDLTGFAPASGAISDTAPETEAETSGRHALVPPDDTATGLMAAVADDEPAEEVAVHG